MRGRPNARPSVDAEVVDQDLLAALAVRPGEHGAVRAVDDGASVTLVLPRLADAVGHQHRRAGLLLPRRDFRGIDQGAAVVRVEDDLRPKPLDPLETTRRVAVGADEARGPDAVNFEQLRPGPRI